MTCEIMAFYRLISFLMKELLQTFGYTPIPVPS